MGLSDLFRRKAEAEDPALPPGTTVPTKALPKLLAALKAREQPVLLDLGPVVGQNVSFFGDELGCKIFVEDLYADIDRHVKAGTVERLPDFLASRFPQAEGSVDGILMWDVFDFLDRPAAQALARVLVQLLRPEGAALGYFLTAPYKGPRVYYRRLVADTTTLELRPYPGAGERQAPLLASQVAKMFEPLRVSEQFLLKSAAREVLFRKPAR